MSIEPLTGIAGLEAEMRDRLADKNKVIESLREREQLASAEVIRLRAALTDIVEIVDGYEDVDDGQPNLAMKVWTTALAALPTIEEQAR